MIPQCDHVYASQCAFNAFFSIIFFSLLYFFRILFLRLGYNMYSTWWIQLLHLPLHLFDDFSSLSFSRSSDSLPTKLCISLCAKSHRCDDVALIFPLNFLGIESICMDSANIQKTASNSCQSDQKTAKVFIFGELVKCI